MSPPPQLYQLVLGITLALLRERRCLLQNELAARVALTKAKMSRIEKGQTPIDPLLLQKLAKELGIEREGLLTFVDQGILRMQKAARQTLHVPAAQWWESVQSQAGPLGAIGLATYAVSLVLSERA